MTARKEPAQSRADHLGNRAVLRAGVPGAEADGRCFGSNDQSKNQERHNRPFRGAVQTLEPEQLAFGFRGVLSTRETLSR